MKFVLVTLAVVALSSAFVVKQQKKISPELEALSGIELVEYVNKAQSLFTVKMNPYFARFTEETKMKIMGVKNIEIPAEDRINEMTHDNINDDTIPVSFDARTAWPQCPSISNIRDQSACGSCWAFGAAEAISDRICIASGGKTQLTISADDIMACCGKVCGNGCEGGYPIQAWKHWVSEGYVTGGAYGSNQGCKPYPFPPCEHHDNATRYQPCQSDLYPNDKCVRSCEQGYTTPYNNDLHFGASAYAVSRKVADIQKEIMTNGPVEVGFTVYEDFETYTGGVYTHTAGKQLGGHAVKMIGWGVDSGTPYWLCTNSWNSDWGEQGYFRILRGVNECGIEGGVVGGVPKV